jgi:hypothetical protein
MRCDGCDIYPLLDCLYAPPCRMPSPRSTKAVVLVPASALPLSFPIVCVLTFNLLTLSFPRILERDTCLSPFPRSTDPHRLHAALFAIFLVYFCHISVVVYYTYHLGSIQCTSSFIAYRISTKYTSSAS